MEKSVNNTDKNEINNMEFKNEELKADFEKRLQNETEGYNLGILEYSKKCAIYMQKLMAGGSSLESIAKKAFSDCDENGRQSGRSVGFAIGTLIEYWKYGDELNKIFYNTKNYSSVEFVTDYLAVLAMLSKYIDLDDPNIEDKIEIFKECLKRDLNEELNRGKKVVKLSEGDMYDLLRKAKMDIRIFCEPIIFGTSSLYVSANSVELEHINPDSSKIIFAEFVKDGLTPYQRVAKNMLNEKYYFDGKIKSDQEITTEVKSKTYEEIDDQIRFKLSNSYKEVVTVLSEKLNLTEEETKKFFDATVNGPENAEIFNLVAEKMKDFSVEKQLDVLKVLHDQSVNKQIDRYNSSRRKIFYNTVLPFELTGWNGITGYIFDVFISILLSVGVQIDNLKLRQAYYIRAKNYLENMNIKEPKDLMNSIIPGIFRQIFTEFGEEKLDSIILDDCDEVIDIICKDKLIKSFINGNDKNQKTK